MIFIEDDREKRGSGQYLKNKGHDVKTKRLMTGDITLEGYENQFSVDLKDLSDISACLTRDEERFVRELERAQQFDYFALLIRASILDIQSWLYPTRLSPKDFISKLMRLSIRYKFPVWFVDNPKTCGLVVEELAKSFLESKGVKP